MPALFIAARSNLPAGPTNGVAVEVLIVSGLLAHEHQCGARFSFAEYGLGCIFVQIASAATASRLA